MCPGRSLPGQSSRGGIGVDGRFPSCWSQAKAYEAHARLSFCTWRTFLGASFPSLGCPLMSGRRFEPYSSSLLRKGLPSFWRLGYRLLANLGVVKVHRQPMDYDGGMLAKRFGLCQDKSSHSLSEPMSNSDVSVFK